MSVYAKNIPEIFGSMVFSDKVMREKLPRDTYKALKKTIEKGSLLTTEVANAVAAAMKECALEKVSTHFTHWFQPMTGITAEKHDSFIEQSNGSVIMEFTGKALIQGEPDASSFPSGGLRATFEARGYTTWDPSSYAFIKEKTLYIPTAFCSYSGQVLDKKTPLLRSMEALERQVLRILALFGSVEGVSVKTTVGAEQEYFLIDKSMYEKRKDLRMCGRTLFGAKPPKGQELEDHYFGSIKTRVKNFMEDLNQELWKLGIATKTEHNEVAPGQHELAPIFTTTNIACDHNQLTMEMMKKVAARHDLVCLLHEKPFAGVNGSGKHNNWSISSSANGNLFEPGDSPEKNAQFLLFLSAVIKAVDNYADLLRVSVSTASNDHRLGASEAPPAIVSIFLGTELTAILESIENGNCYDKKCESVMDIGVSVLPHFPKDNTDRNRTSPFAFTGNKFEFRMVGSSLSIADANIVINTIVAEELSKFADILEKTDDLNAAITEIVRTTYKNHKRIIFNGDGYSAEWQEEAERRNLCNFKTAYEAIPRFKDEKNIALFTKHMIFTKEEIESRCEVMLENYIKTINIEALTMLDMVKKDILPAAAAYVGDLTDNVLKKKTLGIGTCEYESSLISKLSGLSDLLYRKSGELDLLLIEARSIEQTEAKAQYYGKTIFEKMCEIRMAADEIESLTASKYWPYPVYSDILFSV